MQVKILKILISLLQQVNIAIGQAKANGGAFELAIIRKNLKN
jgi:hypothetical protein